MLLLNQAVSYHRLFSILSHFNKGGVKMADVYKTLKEYAETEYIIKKSDGTIIIVPSNSFGKLICSLQD